MKNKLVIGFLTIIVLSGLVVSCGSFATKKVSDVPPVEKIIDIADTDAEVLVDRIKVWFRDTYRENLTGTYVAKSKTADLLLTGGEITYDSLFGSTMKRDDGNGDNRLLYDLNILVKDNKVKVSGKLYKSQYYNRDIVIGDPWKDTSVSDGAIQIFTDHITGIIDGLENQIVNSKFDF